MIPMGTYNGERFFTIHKHSELVELLEWQHDLASEFVKKMIRDAVDTDRWDHMNYPGLKAIHAVALMRMVTGKVVPLNAHTEAVREFAVSLFDAWDRIREGEVLGINKNGGWRPIPRDEICDGGVYEVEPHQHLVVVPGTTMLVLENDPEVDPWTVENVDFKFSYIVNLWRLDKAQITDLIRQFISQTGGKTVFVYTTATNRPQMVDYTEAAIEAGIEWMVWVSSIGGQDGAFKQVRDLCEEAGIRHSLEDKERF